LAFSRPAAARRLANPAAWVLAVIATRGKLGKERVVRSANMPTRNVNLTSYFNQFVDELITSGRFSNASEVMRAGLRLLEQQTHEDEEKLKVLRSLATEAFDELDRGEGTVIESEQQLAEFIDRIDRRAVEHADRRRAGG